MMNKLIQFVKYNNAAVLIVAFIFIIGASALASEPGREAIGSQKTTIEGVDNTLLLAADLEKFNMDFKVEKIEEDEKMYYVAYTYLDLVEENNAWQYQLKENTRRISKTIDIDLGVYLAGELKEEYDTRLSGLKEAQANARANGEEKRIAVTEYSGLIGASLDLATKIFPDYEPIKKEELESPVMEESLRQLQGGEVNIPSADNLEQVYTSYVAENDPDSDDVFGANDNCPNISNSDQLDSNNNGVGDVCDNNQTNSAGNNENSSQEPEDVKVIDLSNESTITGEEAPAVDDQAPADAGTVPTSEAAPIDAPIE